MMRRPIATCLLVTGLAGCYDIPLPPAKPTVDRPAKTWLTETAESDRSGLSAVPNPPSCEIDTQKVPETMERQGEMEPPVSSHDWKYIVLHHSASEGGSVDTIDALHQSRRDQFGNPWQGIGYHFVIGNGQGMPDGQVKATFRWNEQLHGAHARSRLHNRHGIGICLIGNFDVASPTPRQMAALGELCQFLAARYNLPAKRVLRHLDIAATRCPGRLFPYAELLDCLEMETIQP